ncbi:MAG: hypothetical protein LIO43_00755, partial [Clostridiales bacterium]|nr:hypothetical protein [Clostridiales bacterium]
MANEKKAKKHKRMPKIKPINNFALLAFLSLFQIVTAFKAAYGSSGFEIKMLVSMGALIAVEWIYLIFFYTSIHRRNFELELIEFFLCGTGIS